MIYIIDDKPEPSKFMERLMLNNIGMFPFFMSRSAIRLAEKRFMGKIKFFEKKRKGGI